MDQHTFINFHLNKYIQWVRYYPFAVKLDRGTGSCKTHNDLSSRICVRKKTEGWNLSVFYVITGIIESKINH